MPGYVIADVNVTDPALFDEYRKLVPATVAAYDGKYLVRGGDSEVREGDWTPTRTVILQFPSVQRARQWYDSPEYAAPKQMRIASTTSSVIIVDGV